jgi:protein tyrosine phosphatase
LPNYLREKKFIALKKLIQSILKPNAYIAAQGPNEHTINDFWRMVWEQRSFVIVMLTKVFDFIRVMCCQYWPMIENKPEMYGQIEVTLLSEEPLADFVIRTFKVRKPDEIVSFLVFIFLVAFGFQFISKIIYSQLKEKEKKFKRMEEKKFKLENSIKLSESKISSIDNIENGTFYSDANSRDDFFSVQNDIPGDDELDEEEDEDFENERIIYQLHYHNWSSHTCPFPNSLLQFRRRVRIYMNELIIDKIEKVGPTIVHCR